MRNNARRTAPHLPFDHGEPIWRCRYDVIAAIVFAVAGMLIWVDFPNPTHAFTIDLPSAEMLERSGIRLAPTHTLSPRAGGSIEWNGEAVTEKELQDLILFRLYEKVEPEIVFAPEAGASYDLSVRALYLVKRTGATKFCFGGLDDHQHFNSDPLPYRLSATYIIPQIEYMEPLPNPPICTNPRPDYPSAWPKPLR